MTSAVDRKITELERLTETQEAFKVLEMLYPCIRDDERFWAEQKYLEHALARVGLLKA